MERLLDEMNSLNTVMLATAEAGSVDTCTYISLFKRMDDIIYEMMELTAGKEAVA